MHLFSDLNHPCDVVTSLTAFRKSPQFAPGLGPTRNDLSRKRARYPPLVGLDVGLYSEFLADDRVSQLHMAPLDGQPNKGNWVEKAKCALNHGHGIEKVANAAFDGILSRWGN